MGKVQTIKGPTPPKRRGRGRPKLKPGTAGSYKKDRNPATAPRTGRPKTMIDPVEVIFLQEREIKDAWWERYKGESASELRGLMSTRLEQATEAAPEARSVADSVS